jgi:hypothetical protein
MDDEYDEHVRQHAKRVLSVGSEYTLEQLKAQYRQMARRHHPDKGGRQEDFDYLTQCFKFLYEQKTNEARSFESMREAARGAASSVPDERVSFSDDDFQRRFNAFYEKNHLKNPDEDRGYEDFMTEHTVKTHGSRYFRMDKYRPPSPQRSSDRFECHELGGKINDFSGSRRDLHYMDYRRAHTTDKLVDERHAAERATYRNVEELQVAREVVPSEMTDQDRVRYEKEHSLERQREDNRARRAKEWDSKTHSHFVNVNRQRIM